MVNWTQRLGVGWCVKSGWLKPGEWVAAVYTYVLGMLALTVVRIIRISYIINLFRMYMNMHTCYGKSKV